MQENQPPLSRKDKLNIFNISLALSNVPSENKIEAESNMFPAKMFAIFGWYVQVER